MEQEILHIEVDDLEYQGLRLDKFISLKTEYLGRVFYH